MVQPTYSALEIKRMCTDFSLECSIFKTIVELVEEEFHLYSEDDLVILMQASMIMFTRSLLKLSLNNLR